jgi:hypothetical protein
MRRLVVVLSCLVAAGCYERRMNSWIGHSYGELVRTWGTPTTRHARPDGGTLLTWEDREEGPSGDYQTCRRSFAVDRAGTIVHWTIADCDWRSTHIPQPPMRQ